MDIKELISRLFEETKVEKEAVLIIAYGSRVTNTAREDSDLDLLIITAKEGTYRQAIIIDGTPIDMTIMSIEEAEDSIVFSQRRASTYFDGVLKNGLVVLDKIGVYEDLKALLAHKKKEKRIIDGTLINRAEYHIYEFLNNPNNKEVHYFSALELMRRIYHAKQNLPNIQSAKVYDLYTDKRKAREKYMLKLPDDSFITSYLNAIQEHDTEAQKIWLEFFFNIIQNSNPTFPKYPYLDSNQKIIELININNAIWKCEDMILHNHPGAISLYYMLIGELYRLYNTLFNRPLTIDISLKAITKEQMIQNLEYLFSLVDIDHDIDYNDYRIRIR